MSQTEMIKDGHLGGYIRGGDPGTWCPNLWTFAVRELGVQSMLDVGCGEGHSTRFFQELGCQSHGVDGCPKAIADSVLPGQVSLHDFCTGSFEAPHPVDLIWSCEFLEHVDEAYLPNILQTFAQARLAIMITHAFPGQKGHHHVNCQPSSYWIQRIESLGFTCDIGLTRKARTTSLMDYERINHFGRGGLVFVRNGLAASKPSWLDPIRASFKSWRINIGLRWSGPFLEHRRRLRQLKRRRRTAEIEQR